VYTTPASPFNTLAVQFQDEDQVLTTTLVSDLPFFDPALSEPPSIVTHDTTLSGDSTLSDTNLDSLDSSDNIMSSLSISDTAAQTQSSPAANRKQQKVKEMQNLYAVSSKVVGNITGDLYSPVQKFSASSAVPLPPATASVAVAGNTCGEIYGPVASFTQSSAIVGNLSQSASVGGNYGENPGNFGPSSLGSSVIMPSSSQVQFATSGPHAQSQPINYGNFVIGNNTSQIFGAGQSTSQNASGVQNSSGSNGGGGGGGGGGSGSGGGGIIYPRNISSANIASSVSNAECLYGPVLKFRAQNAQLQPATSELKPAGTTTGNYGQTGRTNLVAQNLKSQPLYPQNYPHQQIYSNIAQPGQQAIYLPQMQHVQNVARQNAIPQAISYAAIQHTNQQQSQLSGANPIYTAHATSVSIVQAQKVHVPNFTQQAQPAGIGNQLVSTSQIIGANQSAGIAMQTSSIPSHFIASSAVIQQNIHPMPSSYMVEQPSSLGPIDHTQMHANVDGIMTSVVSAHQQVTQAQMASGVAKTVNVPQMAAGIAKITTFVTSQKQDEQLTSSTDGTLSGSLISSAVSDSTMSSSSSMTEEAQQDQV